VTSSLLSASLYRAKVSRQLIGCAAFYAFLIDASCLKNFCHAFD